MKFTEIQISGLRHGRYSYTFLLVDGFTKDFSTDFFTMPELKAEVDLDYSETMLKAEILISGTVELVCDRSLEPFRRRIDEKVVHFYKFGEEEQELSDELEVISPERVSLDFDQLIYDTVALSIPQKKIHPKFEKEEEFNDSEEGRLIYSSVSDIGTENDNSERESRWEILKNLN